MKYYRIYIQNLHTPWKAILQSMPFWSVVVATVGISWGGSLLANDMNTYLKNIVGYTTAKVSSVEHVIVCETYL